MCSYPGVRAPWNTVCSQNMARLLFTCYSTVKGGEDLTATGANCKEKAGLWISTIFMNPPTTEFEPQWHLCFGKWKGVIPLYTIFKSALFGLPLWDSIGEVLVHCTLNLPPSLSTPLPFRLNVELVQALLCRHLSLLAWL